MITQCSMRHLYELTTIPQNQKEDLISLAKQMERRRCNHHTLEKPLVTLECLASVIDPKQSSTNKNRYVIASQDEEVRKYCRGVKGVPLVYVKRSVMVMEPMAESSVNVKEGINRGKFRMGLRGQADENKRKRKTDADPNHGDGDVAEKSGTPGDEDGEVGRPIKKKRIRGPKGPNPLSVKKPRKREEDSDKKSKTEIRDGIELFTSEEQRTGQMSETIGAVERPLNLEKDISAKKKRKRRHKPPLLSDFGDQGLGSIEDN